MKTRALRIFCFSLALAIILIGCGSSQPNGTDATPTLIIQTPTPTRPPTPVPTAEPLPEDIVVYPGAQLVLAQRTTVGTLYSYISTASLDTVTHFYMDQMPKNDWTQTSAELNGSEGSYLIYTKENRSVMVNIVPDLIKPNQTDISVTLSNNS
jgi:hypothetical protein